MRETLLNDQSVTQNTFMWCRVMQAKHRHMVTKTRSTVCICCWHYIHSYSYNV